MYCTHCGTAYSNDAIACPNCGQAIPTFQTAPALSNWLIPAIIATVCCCPPFGIVALIFSAQVNTKLSAGDIAGAQRASSRARLWTIVAFITAALVYGGIVALALLNR
jgi:Interferon-induced transmembrane protein/zinc-ribbon domain